MSSPPPLTRARPPGLYRAARALRVVGAITTVLAVVFVALVVYSAVQIAQDQPQVGDTTSSLEPNGTVGLASTFEIANPGFFAIQSFHLDFRVANASGIVLASDSTPTVTLGARSTTIVPIALYVPVSAQDESLLTVSQNLVWHVWTNATFGHLFPVSIGFVTNRSWGAPFSGLAFTVGGPMDVGGTIEVPVQMSFTNDASFADSGSVEFQVLSSGGTTCGSGAFDLNVGPNTPFSDSQNVALTNGCDPAGGQVTAEYVSGGGSLPLPSEPIP